VIAVTAEPVSAAAPRENVTRAEARVAPPASVVVPARETQVHIGRVELVVSAPAPPAPRNTAAPRARAARVASPPRDSFSIHRHYLRGS